jgi:hypothetical protein
MHGAATAHRVLGRQQRVIQAGYELAQLDHPPHPILQQHLIEAPVADHDMVRVIIQEPIVTDRPAFGWRWQRCLAKPKPTLAGIGYSFGRPFDPPHHTPPPNTVLIH